MPYRITGTLKLPNGVVAAGVDIKFRALKSYSPLIEQAEITVRTDAAGKYDVSLEFNTYVCEVTFSTNRPFNAGQFTVAVDTVAGQDLPTLLQQAGWTPATPEWIVQIQNWLASANASATSADASAKAAKVSETNSKRSEDAVEADRAEVATNSADVTAKHADVVAKSAQVAQDASDTQAAKATSVQAADTASQKAASAAAHDASAQDSATRAENAASAMVGAVLDGGECNLSGGAYPQPVEVGGKKYSTIWYVAVAGQVSGTSYDVGDLLRYTTAKNGYYFKVDAKDEVYSVNGEKGAVQVTPEKIGAEKTGVAQQLIDHHAAKPSAHQISGVEGLAEALAEKYSPNNKPTASAIGADPSGTAASAVASHELKVNAHPISGVNGLHAALDAKPSRNILINGEVTRINQRGFDGNWANIAVGAYGYDRWKKADATNMTQVVEAGNFTPGAKYRLSGVGVTEKALTAPASGNWSITVPQTARNVQLEIGEVATPFEVRNIQQELAMCQRYYWKMIENFQFYKKLAWRSIALYHPVHMRVAPSQTQTFYDAQGDLSGITFVTTTQSAVYNFSNGNEAMIQARFEFSAEL